MIIVNTYFVNGYEISETLGLVCGSTIRANPRGKDMMAALRSFVGGEIVEYAELIVEARNESLRRMQANAESLGADAIINVRLVTSQVMAGAAELLAYGTAVKLHAQS